MLGPRYTLYSIILVFFSWNKPKLHSVIDMNGRVGLKKVSSRRAGAAASSAKKVSSRRAGAAANFFFKPTRPFMSMTECSVLFAYIPTVQ